MWSLLIPIGMWIIYGSYLRSLLKTDISTKFHSLILYWPLLVVMTFGALLIFVISFFRAEKQKDQRSTT
jgi:hypothetical protein